MLDRLPRATVRVAGRPLPAFRACGVAGFACACAVALGLTAAQGRSLPAQAALIALAVAIFFALALVTKRLLARETLIYYHHEVAVLCGTAAFAALLGDRVLAALDATALGLGAFLAWGRVGCAMVGCCHGRPSRRGLRYAQGPPAYLLGLPLFPVQLVESAGVALLVAAGCALVLAGAPAGTALALYVTGYAVLRFPLETRRGDLARPYLLGVSAAQWTSLALCVAVCALGAAGALPAAPWHFAAVGALAAGAAKLAARRERELLAPLHVREVAGVLERLPDAPTTVRTSAGVRLSRGAAHVSLSRDGAPLTPAEADELARLVAWIEGGTPDLVQGAAGVVHVVHRQ